MGTTARVSAVERVIFVSSCVVLALAGSVAVTESADSGRPAKAAQDNGVHSNVPTLGFRKEPHPTHGFLTYVWAEFSVPAGTICDAWCYESDVEFLDFSNLPDGKVELRHRLRSQPQVLFVTTVQPEPGAVEFAARAIVDPERAAQGKLPDSLPGLNLCFQLRRAQAFCSSPEPYPEFVRRCFLFTDRGMTFLLDTRRRKILHRFAEDDPKNNPPWVQMYVGVWRPAPGVQGQGWAEYSPDRYTIPVVGTVSRDRTYLVAIANGSADSLCNAWHDCLHNNPKWTPIDASPSDRRWRLKVYLMPNDPAALQARVTKDFPEAIKLKQNRVPEQ